MSAMPHPATSQDSAQTLHEQGNALKDMQCSPNSCEEGGDHPLT